MGSSHRRHLGTLSLIPMQVRMCLLDSQRAVVYQFVTPRFRRRVRKPHDIEMTERVDRHSIGSLPRLNQQALLVLASTQSLALRVLSRQQTVVRTTGRTPTPHYHNFRVYKPPSHALNFASPPGGPPVPALSASATGNSLVSARCV